MAKRTLTSIEIPQADSLENVRRVVETIASGSSSRKDISEATDVSLRHVDYAIHAAKSLGFLSEDAALAVSDSGRKLVESVRGSDEERQMLRAAFKANEVLEMLAPDLLDESAPSKSALTERIQKACPELSEATATRRAQTLLAWRSQALASTQVALPLDAPAAAPKPAAEKKAPAPKKVAAPKAPAAKKAAAPKAPAAKKAAPAKAPAAKKAAAPKAPAAKKAAAPKADAKKPAAPKADAKKPAAPKAEAKKPAAKKAAAPKKAEAKKPAAKAAAPKAAANKAAPKKPAAAKAPAAPAAPSADTAPAEAAAPREVTYEPDPDASAHAE